MATTARGTTRTAAKAKAAPTKATPTRKVATPKAVGARTAAAPKAAAVKATPTKATRTKASANALDRVTAAKATPKATPKASEESEGNKYAWGERTREADYQWSTGEAEKLRIDQAGVLPHRLHKAKAELLREMIETGQWHQATKDRRLKLSASDIEEMERVIELFDGSASWRVRDPKTGEPKENGWHQITPGSSQRMRRLIVQLCNDTSPKGRQGLPQIDVWTWESAATTKAKAAKAAKAAPKAKATPKAKAS